MGCVICGDEKTVEAHLLSRAFIHDLRKGAGAKHVIEVDGDRPGVRFHQSGAFDPDLLCYTHEQAAGLGEDYSIRWVRSARKQVASQPSNEWTVPNAKPDYLLRFTYAAVWKAAVTTLNGPSTGSLGPYEKILRDAIFFGGPLCLDLLVGVSGSTVQGQALDIVISPYATRLDRWRVWHFAIGPIIFYLKTDKRPWPADFRPYLANGNDRIILAEAPSRDIRNKPMLDHLQAKNRSGSGRKR